MSDVTGPALLRECLTRLDWAPERFAREICRTAGSRVLSEKNPYHWLHGQVPRPAVRELAALTLSRALGQHVSVPDLWPGVRERRVPLAADAGLDLPWTPAGARRCAELVSRPAGPRLLPVAGAAVIAPVTEWFTASPAASPEHASGEEIGPEVVAVLADRVRQLRRLDDTRAGPLLLDWIRQDLHWAAGLACDCSYGPSTGAALFSVLAEISQLAGWVSTDLGQHAAGQRYLLAALRFAAAGGDAELAAAVVSCLSYLALWRRAPGDALPMIRMARQAARDASPVTAALLASREARACAASGSVSDCARCIDEASALYESRPAAVTSVPSWAYWVTGAVLVADSGRSWLEAGQPARAIPLLEKGLSLFGTSQPRNRLLHEVSRAQAMLLVRDVDGAVEATGQALRLAPGQDSGRVRARLSDLRSKLARCTGSEARSAAGQITDLVRPGS